MAKKTRRPFRDNSGRQEHFQATGEYGTMRAAMLRSGAVRPTLGAAVVRTADGKFGPAFHSRKKEEQELPLAAK